MLFDILFVPLLVFGFIIGAFTALLIMDWLETFNFYKEHLSWFNVIVGAVFVLIFSGIMYKLMFVLWKF